MNRPILVCFYGPESTGKSSMARHMAERYNTEFVPEVAREIVTSNTFTEADIISIGREQTARILEKMKTANKILFCDTDLITTAIYSDTYLHVVPREIAELEKQIQFDQYFLFDIDVPWEADGLRDLGERRPEMLERFRTELEKRSIPYITVTGPFENRVGIIVKVIDALLDR